MKKMVVVTDVRYWRRKTGAQQRIYSLTEYLKTKFDVTTLLVAPIEESNSSHDRQIIQAQKLHVISIVDDWNPQGILEKAKWQLQCVLNMLWPAKSPVTANSSRSIVEFESREFRKRFRQFIDRIGPDIVIVEYVTLAYLVLPHEKRDNILYAVDTHDVLSSRCQQFREQGQDHWVDINPIEEIAALARFDLVIAIQKAEGAKLRKMTPESIPVVVAGHPADSPSVFRARKPDDKVTLGYFASDNFANTNAIEWFLKHVWGEVTQSDPKLKLIIAGSVCNQLPHDLTDDNIQRLPNVIDREEFYPLIDVVINPVQIGTGLKIKNIEALAFGKPLITTTHGAIGLPASVSDLPYLIAVNAEEMANQILQLVNEPFLRDQLSTAAKSYAKSQLNSDQVYARLLEAFNDLSK